jgi:GT2 family glycosyltransferase
MNALVTVNILSYNRREELRITLKKVFEQEYGHIEVIVIDNHSTDGSAEMVRAEFPDVRLIELERNIGIEGWNKGFECARGEYILVLDDDSHPMDTAIETCLRYMENDTLCAVAACNIIEGGSSKNFIRNEDPKKISDFIGCGALLRSSVVRQLKGFSTIVFLYSHELEYTMRVYDAGYHAAYIESAHVMHRRAVKNRQGVHSNGRDLRHHYYFIRNLTIIALLFFPLRMIGLKVLRFLIGQILFCLVNGGVWGSVKAAAAGLSAALMNRGMIKNLNASTQDFYFKCGFIPGFFGDGLYSFSRPKILN